MKAYFDLCYYLHHFFLEWEMFHIRVVEKIKTHILYSITFFPRKQCRLWDNVHKKSGRAKQATNDNTYHALCMLDNQRHRHTLGICNTYCFSAATAVTQTRLDVTFIRILPIFLILSFCLYPGLISGLLSVFPNAISYKFSVSSTSPPFHKYINMFKVRLTGCGISVIIP